jgi:hypothetical protein
MCRDIFRVQAHALGLFFENDQYVRTRSSSGRRDRNRRGLPAMGRRRSGAACPSSERNRLASRYTPRPTATLQACGCHRGAEAAREEVDLAVGLALGFSKTSAAKVFFFSREPVGSRDPSMPQSWSRI